MRVRHLLFIFTSLSSALIVWMIVHTPENVEVSSNVCDPKKDVALGFVEDVLSKDLGVLTLMIDANYYRWLKNNTSWIEVEYKSGEIKKVLIFKSGKMGVIAVLKDGWYCYGIDGSAVDELFQQACS